MKQSGLECGVSYQNINLSLLMYTSYFVLFARYASSGIDWGAGFKPWLYIPCTSTADMLM
jgi:hypothetical protein